MTEILCNAVALLSIVLVSASTVVFLHTEKKIKLYTMFIFGTNLLRTHPVRSNFTYKVLLPTTDERHELCCATGNHKARAASRACSLRKQRCRNVYLREAFESTPFCPVVLVRVPAQ